MRLIFWQNIISPHQAGFMRALAERGHDVTVVARETMSAGRQRLGWEPPSLGAARVVIGPSAADMKRIVGEGPLDTIHCIAGARVDATGTLVARECRAVRRRMGIITETPDPRGIGGLLRWGKYALERMTIGRSFDFVLAMGETGVRWFRGCGYPADRVFPFAYATEGAACTAEAEATAGLLRLLFVGRLVDLKGVDVLLRAMAPATDVELEVIGDGPLRTRLERLADSLGLGPRVQWKGQLKPAEIPPRLAQADVVVLPSRKDGWGAVVNEALMTGTPVICSSACGAYDLVRYDWLGTVVRAGDVQSLRDTIVRWAARGRRTPAERLRIREWSRCITGDSLAAYLEAVFQHVYEDAARPVAPWRSR